MTLKVSNRPYPSLKASQHTKCKGTIKQTEKNITNQSVSDAFSNLRNRFINSAKPFVSYHLNLIKPYLTYPIKIIVKPIYIFALNLFKPCLTKTVLNSDTNTRDLNQTRNQSLGCTPSLIAATLDSEEKEAKTVTKSQAPSSNKETEQKAPKAYTACNLASQPSILSLERPSNLTRHLDETETKSCSVGAQNPEITYPIQTAGPYQGKPNDARIHQIELPIVPENDANTINQSSLQHWMQSHPSDSKDIAKQIGNEVQFVSHEEFQKQLSKTLYEAKLQLAGIHKNSFDPARDAIVLVEGRKSNKWVAELALRNDQFKPKEYYRLGEDRASAFKGYLDAQKTEVMRERLNGKSLILFDDGSYSGQQIYNHVYEMIQNLRQYEIKPASITIIVPFMTKHAFETLKTLCQKTKIPIIIGGHAKINTINHLAKKQKNPTAFEDSVCKMWNLNKKGLENLGLTIFQHKIPNYQSFPENLSAGKVCDLNGHHIKDNLGKFLTIPFINYQVCPYKK